MKLNTKTQKEFFIPTLRIKCFSKVASGITLFQGDAYLHKSCNKTPYTHPIYFIQRNDGVIDVQPAGINDNNAHSILDYHRCNSAFIDPKLQTQAIRYNVPYVELQSYLDTDTGALYFLASHHPSHAIRVKALIILADKINDEDNSQFPYEES